MKSEAVALGERLILQETELDRQFAGRTVTASTLVDATNAIGTTQGELRGTHLRYHLLAVELLTRDQLRRYAELRGYSGSEPGQMHQSHPHWCRARLAVGPARANRGDATLARVVARPA
jgi:hypothetical protein